jgi:methyl-accepting chemotaxis protein
MKMKLNLKFKLSLSFGIVLVFFLINIIFNIYSINNVQKEITSLKEITNKQQEYANDINVDVIQVQQFLSDASATKNVASIKEAEKYKNNFKDLIDKLHKISPNRDAQLKKIDSDFDQYYALGIKMTNAYINEGLQQGNELMDQFDPMASSLFDKVDVLNKESKVSMVAALDTLFKTMNTILMMSLILGLLSLVIVVAVSMILGHNISSPINNMFSILKDLELGEGDLTKRINIISRDEIGNTSHSFNNYMDKLSKMIKFIRDNSTMVSSNAEVLNKGSLETLADMKEINNVMTKVESDSENISAALSKVTSNIENLAQSSQNNSDDVQEICVLADKINAITLHSGEIALNTKIEMDKINEIASRTMVLHEQLGEKTEEIKKIIDTMRGIADQTNILALNASIEASRAGEHGRGFAVVAEEIRKLADNNSESSKLIVNIITSINDVIKESITSSSEVSERVKLGVHMVDNVYSEFEKIIDGTKGINSKIQNIAVTSQEQASSIEEFAATVETVNESNAKISLSIKNASTGINKQTEVISDFNKMAEDLSNSANELIDLVIKFKIQQE